MCIRDRCWSAAEKASAASSGRPSESRQMPAGGNQRLMLLGAALVGFGFFLPWFVINPSSELDRITNHWQLNANFPFSGTRATPGPEQAPAMFPQSGDISISGGDIQRGLGWVTLALALTAALLPYVASTLDAATARTVRLLCLGSGGFIVLYLVTTSFGFVSIGLIIAIGGYVLELSLIHIFSRASRGEAERRSGWGSACRRFRSR